MDERTRAGADEAMVMGSNPARLFEFFFFFLPLEKISKFFGGLIAGTPSAKFPVPVPVR